MAQPLTESTLDRMQSAKRPPELVLPGAGRFINMAPTVLLQVYPIFPLHLATYLVNGRLIVGAALPISDVSFTGEGE